MAKNHSKQFKIDAVQYYQEHKELGLKVCAKNLGISMQSLGKWKREMEKEGSLNVRGSGNYSSDEAKEIARLKRELQSANDALFILKKAIGILGEEQK